MPSARDKSVRSCDESLRKYRSGLYQEALSAGMRSLAWAVLYVGDQIQRQADFWSGDEEYEEDN